MLIATALIQETSVHNFTCFASDVEVFRKGFPRVVPTNIGNGQSFIAKTKKVNADGDIEYVRYHQLLGCIQLVVYND